MTIRVEVLKRLQIFIAHFSEKIAQSYSVLSIVERDTISMPMYTLIELRPILHFLITIPDISKKESKHFPLL